MQLKDLVKPIDQMTDDELLEQIRATRHRREVIRPAARAHIERAEKKESRAKLGSLDKILAGLSEEEKAKLILQLESAENEPAGSSTNGEGTVT